MNTKVIRTLPLAAPAALFMRGCNTVGGVAEDIEIAGDKLENEAKKIT